MSSSHWTKSATSTRLKTAKVARNTTRLLSHTRRIVSNKSPVRRTARTMRLCGCPEGTLSRGLVHPQPQRSMVQLAQAERRENGIPSCFPVFLRPRFPSGKINTLDGPYQKQPAHAFHWYAARRGDARGLLAGAALRFPQLG